MWKKLRKLYEKRSEFAMTFRWLVAQMHSWFWVLCLVAVLNVCLSGMTVLIAAVNKQVVDYATAGVPTFHVGFYLLLAVVTFGNLACSSAMNIFKTFLNEKFAFSMKIRFFRQILLGDWQRLSKFHSGDIMTRITGDMDVVAHGLFNVFPSLIYTVFQFAISFAVLWYFDFRMAVAAFCLAPLGVVLSAGMSSVFAGFQKESRENEAAYRSFMQESMENIVITKSFSQEENACGQMQEFWEARFGIIKRRSLFGFGLNMALGMIFSGGYLVTFGWCLYRLVKGEITYGTVTMMITLLGQIQAPIQNLQSIVQQLVSMFVSAGRVMEMADVPQEHYDEDARAEFQGAIGVRAENLSFAYGEKDESVLKDLSFDIAPGGTVGIVGASGGGKTTIIRLILSLISPRAGRLVLYGGDGVEREASPAARRYISYVPQGNTLVSGSIRKNLQIGKADASEEEMWQALEMAEAEGFVRQFPLGLDTRILEKGGAVSEGQAQRIAIARAVIKPAALLILDEATSSLDIETEAAIVRNLTAGNKDVTRIVITHRPSLLEICEKTYRLEDGRLR